jgi:hypothetical protein
MISAIIAHRSVESTAKKFVPWPILTSRAVRFELATFHWDSASP